MDAGGGEGGWYRGGLYDIIRVVYLHGGALCIVLQICARFTPQKTILREREGGRVTYASRKVSS